MIELTESQQHALDNAPEPYRVVDPRTNAFYVLVRADVYERARELLGEDFDPKEAYAAVDRAFAEGWNDPKPNDYARYEETKE